MPPNGWNCRCYIVPKMAHEAADLNMEEMRAQCDGYLDSNEWKRCEAQGFGINRANEAEVFTADQMYIHKFPDMSSKTLEQIIPREWGVGESLDTLKREAESEVPKYEGSAEAWFDANKVVEAGTELLKVKDYAGRVWQMALDCLPLRIIINVVSNQEFEEEKKSEAAFCSLVLRNIASDIPSGVK